MKIYENHDLRGNNTFGISAKCRKFVEIETAEEAERELPRIAVDSSQLMVIGAGSNLLLTKDFDGTVVRSAIKGVSVRDSLLTAGSGETLDDVIATALSMGCYGMENLSIIPGDVGASAVQNVGAYGVEASDVIDHIDAVEIRTGRRVRIKAADCNYAYRQSRFKNEWKGRYFITSVAYRLQTAFQPRLSYGGIQKALLERGIAAPTAAEVRETIISIRNAKLPDPKKLGNGGSFFMNPVVSQEKFRQLLQKYPEMPYYALDGEKYKIPAGWMIEQCGWKGKALGRAAVHDRQALVLVNLGNAEGGEILALCDAIREDVRQTFGIEIHPEVNII